jgi:hypothetical protein
MIARPDMRRKRSSGHALDQNAGGLQGDPQPFVIPAFVQTETLAQIV